MFLSQSDFSTVVSLTPLIAIDLCILKGRKLLIGKRINPPAQDYFFVPGGRIRKMESKDKALERILNEELSLKFKSIHNKNIKALGFYEHFYKDNFLGNSNFSTHYVVFAYLIPYEILLKKKEFEKNEQHSKYIWMDIDKENISSIKIHKYTLDYLKHIFFK